MCKGKLFKLRLARKLKLLFVHILKDSDINVWKLSFPHCDVSLTFDLCELNYDIRQHSSVL